MCDEGDALRATAATAAAALALFVLRDLVAELRANEAVAMRAAFDVARAALALGYPSVGPAREATVAAAEALRHAQQLVRDAEGALALVAPRVEAVQCVDAIAERARAGARVQ